MKHAVTMLQILSDLPSNVMFRRDPQNNANMQDPIEAMQVDVAIEDNENAEEETYTVDNPTLDLEAYANAYTGFMRINRLIYIADHCPALRQEALKMAITYVLGTYNVYMYQALYKKVPLAAAAHGIQVVVQAAASGAPNGAGGPPLLPDIAAAAAVDGNAAVAAAAPVAPSPSSGAGASAGANDIPAFDAVWLESRNKKAALKLEKLDNDLKNYKSNSIKESIRRGHDDLGDHYLSTGDLSNALKCYSRARDYCTSGKHVVNMCMNVIRVSVYLQNWSHVLSYVAKAEGTPDFAEDTNQAALQTRLKCTAGLAEMVSKHYKTAAKYFLSAQIDHCDQPDLLSPNNVAVYGGLCALATFDRAELQKSVLGSATFKLFLELEPQVRDIIHKFYESKYAACLRLMDDIRDNLRLDVYLAAHVQSLYTMIRNRALVQYFSPYSSADMVRMAEAFNRTVPELENEVMQLILDGQIQARIDSHKKVLFAKDADRRGCTFEKALNVGRDYQRRTKMLILRSAILKNNIVVKNQPREASNHTEYCPATGSNTNFRN